MIYGIEITNNCKALNARKRDPVVRQQMHAALNEAILYVNRQVLKRTPVGVTDVLHGSIQASPHVRDLAGGSMVALTGTSIPHGIPVEMGTKPHWAPIAPLIRWAEEKLGDPDAAFAVRAKIAREGTEGAHMFEEGLKASQSKIKSIFEKHGLRIKTRLMER